MSDGDPQIQHLHGRVGDLSHLPAAQARGAGFDYIPDIIAAIEAARWSAWHTPLRLTFAALIGLALAAALDPAAGIVVAALAFCASWALWPPQVIITTKLMAIDVRIDKPEEGRSERHLVPH